MPLAVDHAADGVAAVGPARPVVQTRRCRRLRRCQCRCLRSSRRRFRRPRTPLLALLPPFHRSSHRWRCCRCRRGGLCRTGCRTRARRARVTAGCGVATGATACSGPAGPADHGLRTGGSPQPGLRCHRRSTDCWSGYRWCCFHQYRLHRRLRCCRCCRRRRHRRLQRLLVPEPPVPAPPVAELAPPAPPVDVASQHAPPVPVPPHQQCCCPRDSCRSGSWHPNCRCCSGCSQPTSRTRRRRRRPGLRHLQRRCWPWSHRRLRRYLRHHRFQRRRSPGSTGSGSAVVVAVERGAAGAARSADRCPCPLLFVPVFGPPFAFAVWVAEAVFVALPALPPLPPLPEELPLSLVAAPPAPLWAFPVGPGRSSARRWHCLHRYRRRRYRSLGTRYRRWTLHQERSRRWMTHRSRFRSRRCRPSTCRRTRRCSCRRSRLHSRSANRRRPCSSSFRR